jgi:hypothetical protein
MKRYFCQEKYIRPTLGFEMYLKFESKRMERYIQSKICIGEIPEIRLLLSREEYIDKIRGSTSKKEILSMKDTEQQFNDVRKYLNSNNITIKTY